MRRRLHISVVLFVLLLCGCYKQVEYPFLHEQTEISSIEIVMVGEPHEQGPNEQIVFVTIDDIDSFMEKLKNLNCYKHVGDPLGIWPNQMAVKIIYSNGEYELINESGQAKYTIEKKYDNFSAFYWFDDEEFETLLASYLGTDVQKAESDFAE